MAEINDLDVTDASNIARWPEGMAPSAVNNAGRADEGILARWHKDENGSVASTGSANAYVFAANRTLSAYYDGLTITFDANFTNTGAATLNVDSVSADAIVWPDQTALVSDDIVSGSKVTVRHDGTSWQLISITRAPMALQTETATTSGTTHDYTGIKATARRITMTFAGVSASGTSALQIQIGDSGGFETASYLGSAHGIGATGTSSNMVSGFLLMGASAAANVYHGVATLVLEDSANNTWAMHSSISLSNEASIRIAAGEKSLSAVLTQVRLTTVNGTDTFDAGAVNILVE